MVPFHRPPWCEIPEGLVFIANLKACPDLTLFNGHMQVFANGATRVSLDRLAIWMVERAMKVGAEQTVREVENYIEADCFDANQILLLSGILIEHSFDLGNHIMIVPQQDIPYFPLRNVCSHYLYNFLPVPKIEAAILRACQHPKQHIVQSAAAETRWQPYLLPTEPLTDAHLCLSLATTDASGSQAIATGIVPADHVPILGGVGWSYITHRSSLMVLPSINGIEGQQAFELHRKFRLLPSDTQDRLRIPLQKLNHYAATRDLPVQAAVDLRTALEAFYLDKSVDGELSERVALRTALFADGDFARRKTLRTAMKRVYTLASNAVHTGHFPKKRAATAPQELEEAAQCLRNALLKVISRCQASISWEDLELHGEGNGNRSL